MVNNYELKAYEDGVVIKANDKRYSFITVDGVNIIRIDRLLTREGVNELVAKGFVNTGAQFLRGRILTTMVRLSDEGLVMLMTLLGFAKAEGFLPLPQQYLTDDSNNTQFESIEIIGD